MRYVLHEGHSLYLSESYDEDMLIRYPLEQLMAMQCNAFQIWGPLESKEGWRSRAGCWYPFSCVLPVTMQGEPLTAHVANIRERNELTPFVFTVDVALPTGFMEDGELVTRWSTQMSEKEQMELFCKLCTEHVPFFRFREDRLIQHVTTLLDRL